MEQTRTVCLTCPYCNKAVSYRDGQGLSKYLRISPRLQKQLEKIRKHMPKISLPRKRKSDLVNENGNSNQNENDPDDEIPPSKKQKTSRLGGPKSKRR